MDKLGKKTLNVMQGATRYNAWLFDNFFKKHLKGEILEIGAGVGTFVDFSRKLGKVTATDISKEYLDNIKSRFSDVKIQKLNIEKNATQKKFDSIYSLNVFEHIENDEKAMRNVYKMLKKKGKFVILVPSHDWNYNEMDKRLGHFRRYNKKLIKNKLEKAGFRVTSVRYANMIGALGWWFVGRILQKKQVPSGEVSIFDKLIAPISLYIEKFFDPPFGLSVIAIATKK